MAIGKDINAAMQLDGRFDLWIELPLQPSLDEIAIQTAEHLTGALATEVQMCEIVHPRSLALPHQYRYNPIYRFTQSSDRNHIGISRNTDLKFAPSRYNVLLITSPKP